MLNNFNMKTLILAMWLAGLAIGQAQTPVVFPLQNMFGGPYAGGIECKPSSGIYNDGTNIWIAQPIFSINTNNCYTLTLPCAPNKYWIQFGQYGFGFYVPSGLGTNPVSIFSLQLTNLPFLYLTNYLSIIANIAPGANVYFTTNNGVTVINSSGGGGGTGGYPIGSGDGNLTFSTDGTTTNISFANTIQIQNKINSTYFGGAYGSIDPNARQLLNYTGQPILNWVGQALLGQWTAGSVIATNGYYDPYGQYPVSTNTATVGAVANIANAAALSLAGTATTNNFGGAVKASGTGTNLQVGLTYGEKTINEWNLPNWYNAINVRTNAVRIMILGDSTATPAHGSPSYGLASFFSQYIPNIQNGELNDGLYWNGPGVQTAADDTNWFAYYQQMPAGTWTTNDGGFFNFYGSASDTIKFAAKMWPHGGVVNVYGATYPNNPLTQVASINLQNATTAGFFTNIPAAGNYYAVVQSVSADAGYSNIVYFAVSERANTKNLIIYNEAVGAHDFAHWINVPTNLFLPVFAGLSNDVTIIEQKNAQGTELATNLPILESMFTNAMPNSDFVWMTPVPSTVAWPGTPTGDDYGYQMQQLYANCLLTGQMYFDEWDMLPSTNVLLQLGLLNPVDQFHFSTQGGQFSGELLARQMWRIGDTTPTQFQNGLSGSKLTISGVSTLNGNVSVSSSGAFGSMSIANSGQNGFLALSIGTGNTSWYVGPGSSYGLDGTSADYLFCPFVSSAFPFTYNYGVVIRPNGDIVDRGTNYAVAFAGTPVINGGGFNAPAAANFPWGINSAGTVTATRFIGSGASLTTLPAAQLTGTAPASATTNAPGFWAAAPSGGGGAGYVATNNGTAWNLTVLTNTGSLGIGQTNQGTLLVAQNLGVGGNVAVGGTITATSFYSTGINGYNGNGGALTNNTFNIYSIASGSLVNSNQAGQVAQATVANASLPAAHLTGTAPASATTNAPGFWAAAPSGGGGAGYVATNAGTAWAPTIYPIGTTAMFVYGTNFFQGTVAVSNQVVVGGLGTPEANIGLTVNGSQTNSQDLLVGNNLAVGGTITGNGVNLTNIPPSAIFTVTNTSGVNGVINFTTAEGTLYTNASFTFQAAVVANPSAYQDFLLEITNSSGSLINISGAPGWFTNGTWNCTNISQLFLHEHVGMFTNAFMQPLK
jgi:hypothetical protein